MLTIVTAITVLLTVISYVIGTFFAERFLRYTATQKEVIKAFSFIRFSISLIFFGLTDEAIFLHIFKSIRKFCPHLFLDLSAFILFYRIDLKHFL